MGTLIKNVNVFDGKKFIGVKDIAIEGNRIVSELTSDSEVIDGTGKTLLPGFWDCHVHVYDRPDFLKKSRRYGNTTILDMGCRIHDTIDKMRAAGIVNILSPYFIAVAPTSSAIESMQYPEFCRMKTPEDGVKFVHRMIEWGADYIKIILEEESGVGRTSGSDFPIEIGKAIVDEAHKFDLKVIAHAVTVSSWRKGIAFGVDILTHMPMSEEIPDDVVEAIVRQGITLTPTITMMDAIATNIHKKVPQAPVSKKIAEENLKKLIKAGAEILVSTDANEDDPCPPASVEYGLGLLNEMENIKECGMSNTEVLMCATSKPAEYFGQPERGIITPGKIADLVLVNGNPEANLADIYNIDRVLVGGQQFKY